MLAQRAVQQSLRRLAASQPSMISQMAFKNTLRPLALGSTLSSRPLTTEKLTPTDSYNILVAQRKNRPNSPHLQIYRPQITSFNSIMHRFTGGVLSAGFYVFGAAYLVSPLFGWHLDTASMVSAFAGLPAAVKVAAKFAFALPFTFHSFNGVRHLAWDMGTLFSNKMVIVTGWTTIGVSVLSALVLAML